MRALDYWASRELVKKHDIPVCEGELVRSESEALEAARKIGYPVVIKAVAEGATHKTDVGGVVTHINCDEELVITFRNLVKELEKKGHKLTGVTVEKMERGFELIVGAKTDELFGKVILFGLGGVLAEVFKVFSVRVLPIRKKDAMEMLTEIKQFDKLLGGFRNIPPVNREKLASFILKVAKLVEKEQIYEMDLNPVFVFGDRIVATDYRIVLEG